MYSRLTSSAGGIQFQPDTPRKLEDGLEPTLHSTIPTLGEEDITGVASETLRPTNLQTVSSYNWVYGPGAQLKIIVPGYPPCWTPQKLPLELPSDVGFRFIHQNEYFSPGTPLRPLLRSIYTQQPNFNVKGFDFIVDRNNLMKLFKFVRGGTENHYRVIGQHQNTKVEPSSPPKEIVLPHTPPTSPGIGIGRGRGSPTTWTAPPPCSPPANLGNGDGKGSPPGGSWRDRHPPSRGGGLRGALRAGGYGADRGRGSSGPEVPGRGRSDGRYINGEWSPNFKYRQYPVEDTRIDVDIMGEGAGSSMLMSRWDTQASEIVKKEQFMGWGYQFANAFSKFGDAGEDAVVDGGEAGNHYRVISYDFGGYKFLVRCHADAVEESLGEFRWWAEKNKKEQEALGKVAEVVEKLKGKDTTSQISPGGSPGEKGDDWLEKEFAEGISKLNLSSMKAPSAIEAHKTSTLLYPHSSIVQIKTCSEKNHEAMIARAMPQAFFAQTPHLYVGYHDKGNFQRIDKLEMAEPLSVWEKENHDALKKLVALLRRIREAVESIEGRSASIVFCQGKEGEGVKVYKKLAGSDGPVPSDLMVKWD